LNQFDGLALSSVDLRKTKHLVLNHVKHRAELHKGAVRSYKINKAEGWHCWQIYCEDLERTMG